MKKLSKLLGLALSAILIAGGLHIIRNPVKTALAQETVYKTALFGQLYNSKGVSSYTGSFSSTNDGFTVDLANFNNNNNGWSVVKTGNKSSAKVGTITTNQAIDKPITKVVVTIDAVTATSVNSITLFSGSAANSITSSIGTFDVGTGAKSVSISSPTKDLFYQISFDCQKGSNNGLVTVSKVEFYYDRVVNVESISLDSTVATLAVNETLQLNATITPSNADNKNIVWVSSETTVATVSDSGLVTALSVGRTTITALTVDQGKEASCVINVAGDATEEQINNMKNNLNLIDAWFSFGFSYHYNNGSNTSNKTDVLIGDNTSRLGDSYSSTNQTSYVSWSGNENNYTSGAEYSGFSNCQAGSGDTIDQNIISLRGYKSASGKDTFSGIISKKSNGILDKITLAWNRNVNSGRKIRIHASNTPFTSIQSDLYVADANSTYLPSDLYKVVDLDTTQTEFTFAENYKYIGITSASNDACFLDSIKIEWKSLPTYSDFKLRVGVTKPSAKLSTEFSYDFGIEIVQGSKTVRFELDELGRNSSEVGYAGDTQILYKVINLGDVLNNISRTDDVFTIRAYVHYKENLYYPLSSATTVKSYSLSSLIDAYYSGEYGEQAKNAVTRLREIIQEIKNGQGA